MRAPSQATVAEGGDRRPIAREKCKLSAYHHVLPGTGSKMTHSGTTVGSSLKHRGPSSYTNLAHDVSGAFRGTRGILHAGLAKASKTALGKGPQPAPKSRFAGPYNRPPFCFFKARATVGGDSTRAVTPLSDTRAVMLLSDTRAVMPLSDSRVARSNQSQWWNTVKCFFTLLLFMVHTRDRKGERLSSRQGYVLPGIIFFSFSAFVFFFFPRQREKV